MTNTTFPRMHVSLYVTNLAVSQKFYTEFFQTSPVKVKPGYLKYVLEKPSLIISFIENSERVQSHFGHLGFQVETQDELEKIKAVMQEKNLVGKEESNVACCYAKQDKFWTYDPDGVEWEVYYFHEDAEFNDPFYETTETNACCMPAKSADVCCEKKEGVEYSCC